MSPVRTTVAFPEELLQAADREVREGKARNRNELLVLALRHELEARERAAIDAAFLESAHDAAAQEEALAVAEEFVAAGWEALGIGVLE